MIALNRFLAIFFPVGYKLWFSTRNTLKIIAVTWVLAFFHSIVYFFDGCDFFFDPSLYIWLYAETVCGYWIGLIPDLSYGMCFFFLIFVLNVLTVLKIRKTNQVRKPCVALLVSRVL